MTAFLPHIVSKRKLLIKLGHVARRKQHKGFEKLLSLGGLWEIVKGKGKAITPAPFWVWEGLATHTPAAAELAAQAADVASAAKYFEVSHCQKHTTSNSSTCG